MAIRYAVLVVATTVGVPAPAAGQDWNSPRVRDLVDQAVARRAAVVETGGLTDYRARADGLVMFMTQFGAEFREPPRIAKTDQLALEILWRFPTLSKQRIMARRDRTDLPTDIRYHRDHLGIVQNSFGNRIRLGDGHEVRDVPHPMSAEGRSTYEYAIRDSITLEFPDRVRSLLEVAVRPVPNDAPGVVGSVFLDASTAEIVRFSFGFTRAAYRDDSVEDISISLEHALWEGRYWLPREQVIEIRRHTSWLDFPARSIIRAVWEIDDYEFNVGLGPAVFRGPEIVAGPMLPVAGAWDYSLDSALRRFNAPSEALDVDQVRRDLTELVSRSALTGLPTARIGGNGVSDLVRFNRVEGLRLGLGGTYRLAGGAALGGWVGYGTSDRQFKGRGSFGTQIGGVNIELGARRTIDDVGAAAASGVVNSILAQEGGRDLGHYLLNTSGRLGIRVAGWNAYLVRERVAAVDVVSRGPAWGTWRPNPPFQPGDYTRLGVGWDVRTGRMAATATVESGTGPAGGYGAASLAGLLQHPMGRGDFTGVVGMGLGTQNLPAHRSFSFGGPGTLPGERFRAWGGRAVLHGLAEWQIAIPVPVVTVASWVDTGSHLVMGVFVGGGLAWDPVPTVPWGRSDGVRTVIGVSAEWLHRLVRFEAGYSVRDRRVRLGFDATRVIWGIL